MNNYLILRTLNSPYSSDVTKGATLTFTELDDNFIFLKGNIIYTSETIGNIITLKKYNGEDISFTAATGGGTGSDTYWTSGSTGDYSVKTINDSTVDATGFYAVAMNHNTLASGLYSFASGSDSIASGATAHAEGSGTIAGGVAAHAEGVYTTAIGYVSHAEGAGTIASGATAHAEGSLTVAGGVTSHAEGDTTQALGVSSHSEGVESNAIGDVSHAEGGGTIASGNFSHAEGIYTTAIGQSSHAEGAGTLAVGFASHAEGVGAQALGDYSHAGGNSTIAGGNYSVAYGTYAITTGFISSVFGEKVSNVADYSNIHGGGYHTILGTASTYSTIINGHTNKIFSSDTATIINGYSNTISGSSKQSSIVNGQFNVIGQSQFASIVGGNANNMFSTDGSAIIGGSSNRILSDGNPAFTRYYNAILGGTGNTIDNSELSFIMGGYQNVIPYGTVGSVILGGDSITATTDNTVFVQRLNIKYTQNDNLTTKLLTIDANGLIKYRDVSSISGGTGSGGTTVDLYWASGTTGLYSIKANNGTTTDALGNYSIAEGFNTLATGIASHAEGAETNALANYSHAQNYGSQSKGLYSHAGGYNSTASGNTSFVHSYSSSANGDRSVVLGGSNINGSANDTVYVPYLNIQSATTDNTISNILVRNGDGILKSRQLDSLYSAVTSINVGSLTASTYYNLPINTLSQVLSSGNTTGANNIVIQDTKGLRTSDGFGGLTCLSGAFVRTYYGDGGVNWATTDWEAGNLLQYASSGPITSEIGINGVTGNRLLVDATSATTLITQTQNTIEVTNTNTLTPGVQYAADYSANFKNNTLVTRKFVETGMSGLTINGNLTYSGQANNPVYTAGTVTATHIPNWNNSNIQTVILSAATTSISGGTNIANGAVYTMILKQNATGSRVVTWGAQYKWQSGIAPILTATANGVDILTFISDGTNLYGLIAKDFR